MINAKGTTKANIKKTGKVPDMGKIMNEASALSKKGGREAMMKTYGNTRGSMLWKQSQGGAGQNIGKP